MSTYASQRQFSELWYRAGCVDWFFTSEELSLSQSNSKSKLPLVPTSPFRGDTTFFRTQGSHILGCGSGSCCVKSGSPADNQHAGFAAPLLLCWQQDIPALSWVPPWSWCASGKHHKVLRINRKRKEPCLPNSISFPFSPLLITFLIYSLFWNCFQTFFPF